MRPPTPCERDCKDQWTGTSKFKAMVLGDGLRFEPMSLNHEDAQFVESKRLAIEDIARIYRSPSRDRRPQSRDLQQ